MEGKRKLDVDSDSSSSDDEAFGPTLDFVAGVKTQRKKPQVKKRIIMADLKLNPIYVNSYMHRDNVTVLAQFQQLLVTGSKDGAIKFWNTQPALSKPGELVEQLLEFIRLFQTGGEIIGMSVDTREGVLASIILGDTLIRVFDLRTFDMINLIELSFEPSLISYAAFDNSSRLVVVKNSNEIVIVDPEEALILDKVSDIHRVAINSIDYNAKYKCMISTDVNGMIEYWTAGDQYKTPPHCFSLKSKTNLYDIRKLKSTIQCLSLSSDGEKFLTVSLPDNKLRIFEFKTGLLVKVIDNVTRSAVFDNSGNFVLYATEKGIEIYNLVEDSSEKIGTDDELSINQIILIQPDLNRITIDMATTPSNELLTKKLKSKPRITLLATCAEDQRFYIYNNSESKLDKTERDIYNEAPSATTKSKPQRKLTVVLHTNMGDIKLEFFPKQAPIAVENFIKLCSNNYYDNIIFHRIIKEFMVQTGDPTGTGTGGESIFGDNFEDEFSPDLKHTKYMVSMANAGANTNRSQFFIVTSDEPLQHLDNKHTVFARVISGEDVVDDIAQVEVDSQDRPIRLTPKIVSTSITWSAS